MWALLSTRFRRWLLFVIGVPILAKVLNRVADWFEKRRGPKSRTVSALRSSGDLLRRSRRRRRRRRIF